MITDRVRLKRPAVICQLKMFCNYIFEIIIYHKFHRLVENIVSSEYYQCFQLTGSKTRSLWGYVKHALDDKIMSMLCPRQKVSVLNVTSWWSMQCFKLGLWNSYCEYVRSMLYHAFAFVTGQEHSSSFSKSSQNSREQDKAVKVSYICW